MTRTPPVAIIGAGPVGLAAAAHLHRRGEPFVVVEAGPRAGHAVRQWGHVRLFSPWREVTDRASVELLRRHGWAHPDPEEVPDGDALCALYLEPLAALPALAPHIRFGARVISVGRKDFDKVKTAGREAQPFVVEVERADGGTDRIEARAVIDASGTWARPNPAGSGGVPAPGERAAADRIDYAIPDVRGAARAAFAGRTVLVLGSGHSAMNAILDLQALKAEGPDTRILWAIRRADVDTAFGGGAADQLPLRGALGATARNAVRDGMVELVAPFRVRAFRDAAGGRLEVVGDAGGEARSLVVDRVVAATGFRPDFTFASEIRLGLDPWLECAAALGPLIDPNIHSCGTVRPHGAKELAHPEAGFFVVGMKSYGRAPTFLMLTGYEQVRSVVASLVGDEAAAARVELVLPETGVCRATPRVRDTAGEPRAAGVPARSCCG
ncbi:MAG TPA: NAD(P)-binding domain-containing protein [Azospirillaceae bacterium]|nr:NAD(P)-binding domain-containing protein [Azospirillaceae bacterium]